MRRFTGIAKRYRIVWETKILKEVAAELMVMGRELQQFLQVPKRKRDALNNRMTLQKQELAKLEVLERKLAKCKNCNGEYR